MKMKLALVIQKMEEASDAYTLFYDMQEEKRFICRMNL